MIAKNGCLLPQRYGFSVVYTKKYKLIFIYLYLRRGNYGVLTKNPQLLGLRNLRNLRKGQTTFSSEKIIT